MSNEILLSVANLHVAFRQGSEWVSAVNGISFDIRFGETFALVGESGSGKSVTALSVLRLLPLGGRILQGSAKLDGSDLFKLPEYELCKIRGRRIGVIFQDPMSSLNPVMTIGQQIGEVLRLHFGLKGNFLGSLFRSHACCSWKCCLDGMGILESLNSEEDR